MKTEKATAVRDVMSTDVLTVDPGDSIREAALRMSGRNVGAAIVRRDPDIPGSRPGIVTERDVLRLVGAGQHASHQRVADWFTPDAFTAPPGSSLRQAAKVMSSGGFRHLVVFDGRETLGVVSVRDLVRSWVKERNLPGLDAPIEEAMRADVLAVGPQDTLREAALRISERNLDAAMVEPDEARRLPGIISAREILRSVAAGQDPDAERVADHRAPAMTFSAPSWSLSQAAEAMTKGGFQHILVVDVGGIRGTISMRDLVRDLTNR